MRKKHPRTVHKEREQLTGPHPQSITGFCARHGISKATWYNLHRRGIAPRTMKLGAGVTSKVVISAQAEADWIRQREAETARKSA